MYLWAVNICACTFMSILIWAKGWCFEGHNFEQEDAVLQLFESNSWPWNVEVTNVCETESTALSTSLDKPCPFVFKLSSLESLK